MMATKITVYNRDGSVLRREECAMRCTPHGSNFIMVELSSARGYVADPIREIQGFADRPHFITNMAIHVEGVEMSPEPAGGSPLFSITIYGDNGKIASRWEWCAGLSYLKSMVFFWHGGKSHMVCGNVIVERTYVDPEKV
jgi:hypothetical protein